MKSKDYKLLPIFNQCLTEFFPDRSLSILNEVDDFAKGKIPTPSPRECGNNADPQLKFLLPKNLVTVMYWIRDSKLEFFAVLDENDRIHTTLYSGMLLDRKTGRKG